MTRRQPIKGHKGTYVTMSGTVMLRTNESVVGGWQAMSWTVKSERVRGDLGALVTI